MTQREDKSKQYQRLKHRIFFINIILDFVVLGLIFHSGLSLFLKEKALQVSSHPFLVNGIYFLSFSFIFSVVHFPLSFLSGFHLEHKFHLSQQSFKDWLDDYIKQSILGFIFIFLAVEALYFFLGVYPHVWWIWAGLFWIFLSFVLTQLMPNVIIPLFFKYSTINSPDLKMVISSLFKRCDVALKEVYSIDLSRKTKKANAFLCGLGKNRRVVLGDTLINNFSIDEIEVVVAHELGHFKHRDLAKILMINSVFTLWGLRLIDKILTGHTYRYQPSGKDDIVLFPILVLCLYCFVLVVTPLINTYSRHIEKSADQFSIEVTKKPQDFISLMEKLAKMNLAEKAPNKFVEWFLYDHPTIEKRIQFAQKYLK